MFDRYRGVQERFAVSACRLAARCGEKFLGLSSIRPPLCLRTSRREARVKAVVVGRVGLGGGLRAPRDLLRSRIRPARRASRKSR